MKVSSEPRFWEFNNKRVTDRQYAPCRNLEGTNPREDKGYKTKKEVV